MIIGATDIQSRQIYLAIGSVNDKSDEYGATEGKASVPQGYYPCQFRLLTLKPAQVSSDAESYTDVSYEVLIEGNHYETFVNRNPYGALTIGTTLINALIGMRPIQSVEYLAAVDMTKVIL